MGRYDRGFWPGEFRPGDFDWGILTVSSSSPALPTVLRVRDISNLSSHTVHSAEYTGNCAWGLNEELPIAAKSRANKVLITLP